MGGPLRTLEVLVESAGFVGGPSVDGALFGVRSLGGMAMRRKAAAAKEREE